MKKLLIYLLLLMSTTYTINAQNVLPNGNFESAAGSGATTFASWTTSPASSLTTGTVASGGFVHGGSNSLKIVSPGNNLGGYKITSAGFSVTNGTTYEASFWVYPTAAAQVHIILFGQSQSTVTLTAGVWQQVTFAKPFTGTTGTTAGVIVLELGGGSAGTLYVDDVEVKPLNINNVINGGFELGSGNIFTNWTNNITSAPMNITSEATIIRSGSRALKAASTSANSNSNTVKVQSDAITTVVGKNYEVAVWIRSGASNISNAVKIEAIGTATVQSSFFTVTTTWQRMSLVFKADATTTKLSVLISGTTSGNPIFIDDAEFNSASCGTPTTSSTSVSACNSYTYHDVPLTASGYYTYVTGCDTETLHLTIIPAPTQPTIACYQTATFNSDTCSWTITGTQPTPPTLACYETLGSFNATTCAWDVTGTQPTAPTGLACYQTATLNTTTCTWDVTGTQPAPPTTSACETLGSFNTTTCAWDVIGAKPTTACYETATLDTSTCTWTVTGTQPAPPTTLACYETLGSFNTTTCAWDIIGTQPAPPAIEFYQTLGAFNNTTCAWNVTGTPPPSITYETEAMTKSGPYAGNVSSPFNGMGLYGNTDAGSTTVTLPTVPGRYSVTLIGASSNTSAASVDLEIDGVVAGSFSFTGTAASSVSQTMSFTGNTSITIKLIMRTDNGSNNLFLDKITFTYLGEIPPPRNPPVLPAVGAVESGIYRNMFVEAGYNAADVTLKINNTFQQFFYGNDTTERIYYPVGTDEAYILDTGNNDVRSEGMSYGMMICVQMNKKAEFDRLWKWAYTHMRHDTGARKGYFAWQCSIAGSKLDNNPASDGEEYFATALLFASKRWGDGQGIYNYGAEANNLLETVQNKENPIVGSVTNLINVTQKKVVFVPYASAALFTDPSYHLPAFYEVWAASTNTNNTFWSEVATTSRSFFLSAAHPTTGLMPDYANFDGTPNNQGGHGDFLFDAWRCMMNMGVDYAWYKKSANEKVIVEKVQSFFKSKGVSTYGNQYKIDGTALTSSGHSPGLIACNAVGSLASDSVTAWEFIDDFYNTGIPSGKYRYYDGLLYLMSMLHVSGEFKAYIPTKALSTSNQTLLQTSKIKLFPNPVSNNLVNINGLTPTVEYNITVSDITGHTILNQKVSNAEACELPLHSIHAKGIYIVNIKSSDENKNIKLIKQ